MKVPVDSYDCETSVVWRPLGGCTVHRAWLDFFRDLNFMTLFF